MRIHFKQRNINAKKGNPFFEQILFFVLFGILLLSAGHISAQEIIADEKITGAVEADLLLSDEVVSHLVDVKTSEGVVTLTGTVDNILAKEQAADIARSIKGVISVVNNITVKPVARADSEIQLDVKEALIEDPATESFEVEVKVSNGIVTLSGEVQSYQEKQLAAQVVKGVRGVKNIENNLDIVYRFERTDKEIELDIERRLMQDVWVDEGLIQVEVEDGKVILGGTVGSAAQKRWAKADAWVTGTKSVDADNLEVEWWARDEMKRKSQHFDLSDREIADAVQDAFTYDPRVLSFNIDTEVEDGVVTLSGVVDNLRAKEAAETDAKNTIGVLRVRNLIRVRPETVLTEKELEDYVRKALSRDPYLEPLNISVHVMNGRAYLAGEVNTSFEKKRARKVVSKVEGIVTVINNIEYRHRWTSKPDWQIKQDVLDQLAWNAFVEAKDVEVEVEEGVVTLTGRVDTWRERVNAEISAYDGGAKDVKNRLQVKYFRVPPFISP